MHAISTAKCSLALFVNVITTFGGNPDENGHSMLLILLLKEAKTNLLLKEVVYAS